MQPRVAAIVVTHNRAQIAATTVRSLLSQGLRPDPVVVVDSGSTDGTLDFLRAGFPTVTVIEAGENVGYGAGLALGMAKAEALCSPDYFLLLDDDSPLEDGTVQKGVELASQVEHLGVLGNRGGRFSAGRIRHFLPSSGVRRADFCLVDGAIVSGEAVRKIGYPRTDFFMMHEDVEYTSRIAAGGFTVLVGDAVRNVPQHLGAKGEGGSPLWRLYYQSRNHLRFVIDQRWALGIFGWVWREGAIVLAGILRRDRPVVRARLVSRGAVDALRGRMGRTIEPGSI